MGLATHPVGPTFSLLTAALSRSALKPSQENLKEGASTYVKHASQTRSPLVTVLEVQLSILQGLQHCLLEFLLMETR
jgi:hypothetical protein